MQDSITAHPYARAVAAALQRAGFLNVKLEEEVAKAQWRTSGRPFIPFDVTYTALAPWPHREYLECKHHGSREANEQEVAKFIQDLRTCGLDTTRGSVVTTNGYTPLAKDYARASGVRLYTFLPRSKTEQGIIERAYERFVTTPRAILNEVKESVTGRTNLPDEFRRMR